MVLGDGNAGKVRPEQIVQLILGDNSTIGQWNGEENEQYPPLDIEIIKTGSFIEDRGKMFSPWDTVISSRSSVVP